LQITLKTADFQPFYFITTSVLPPKEIHSNTLCDCNDSPGSWWAPLWVLFVVKNCANKTLSFFI